MSDFGERLREYIRDSADRKLTVGRMAVSRLAFFGIAAGIAAGILVAGVLALLFLVLSKRDKGLTFTRADVVSGYTYRMKDDVLSYRTEDRIYTYDAAKDVSTFFPIANIEGYDSSASMTVVYAGAQFKIQGAEKTLALQSGTILDVRAGKNFAALLYRIPVDDRDERFIEIIRLEIGRAHV